MLKKTVCIMVLLMIGLCGKSFAGIIQNGGTIIDYPNGLAWYANLDDFWDLHYDEQISAIDDLNIDTGTFGYNNWRMATTIEVQQMFVQWDKTSSPLDYFSITFSTPAEPYREYFWDARTFDHNAILIKCTADQDTGVYGFEVPLIRPIADDISLYQISAWVVTDMPVNVPEPGTFVLFASGILVFTRISKKNHFPQTYA